MMICRSVALLTLFATMLSVPSAHAQAVNDESAESQEDPELLRARELFAEAVGEAQLENHRRAVELFREVLAIRDSPAVRYNLAVSLSVLNEIMEADELIQSVLQDRTTSPALRTNAADLRLLIEEQGAQLTISVEGVAMGTFETMLNDTRIENPRLGRILRVRSGAHAVRLQRGNRELASERFTLAPGEQREVVLTVEGESFGITSVSDTPIDPELLQEEAPPRANRQAENAVNLEDEETSESSMSAGAKVGIALAIIAVLAGGAVATYFLTREDAPEPVQGTFSPGVLTFD